MDIYSAMPVAQGVSQLQQQHMIQCLTDQNLKTKLIHSGNMKNNLIRSNKAQPHRHINQWQCTPANIFIKA